MKIARSGILSEFASANCSQGVRNQKKTRVRMSRLSTRGHESYKSRFLLVTPISHTHSNYLHMHAPIHSRRSTLVNAVPIQNQAHTCKTLGIVTIPKSLLARMRRCIRVIILARCTKVIASTHAQMHPRNNTRALYCRTNFVHATTKV